MKTKLTKAQQELLVDLERSLDGEQFCAPYYRPAQRLVVLGLAQWRPFTHLLRITDAGRAALSEHQK